MDSLLKLGIALWDVIGSCLRSGSLDSAIENSTVTVNDFNSLLDNCSHLNKIFFNGKMAEAVFRKHVLPALDCRSREMEFYGMPSTSPAFASMSKTLKLEKWKLLSDKVIL